MNHSQRLSDKLQVHGVLQESVKTAEGQVDSPWYIRILMAFCGWLAAMFGLAFLGLGVAELFDSAPALTVLGGVLLAAAFYFLAASRSEFIEHLGLALSVAGQALIAFALFSVSNVTPLFAWSVLLIMQLALVYFMPNYIHRLISTYLATLCLLLVLRELNLLQLYSVVLMLGFGLIWVNEFQFGQHVKKLQAIGYGLVLGAAQFKTSLLFSAHGKTWEMQELAHVSPWFDELLNLLVLLLVLYMMISRNMLSLNSQHKGFALGVLLMLITASFFAHGIVLGVLIILLGYAASNRVLMALGIISALINLSSYYYLLNLSLLYKSLTLIALGMLALLLSYINHKVVKNKVSLNG